MSSSLKYLFCCGGEVPSKGCCCGCSLKVGVQIITILNLIISIGSMSGSSIFFDGYYGFGIFNLVATIALNIVLFISTINYNYTLALIAYIVNAILFIIVTIGLIVFGILLIVLGGAAGGSGRHDVQIALGFLVVIFLIIVIGYVLIEGYFLWIVFCFTKYLGMGKIDIIEGRDTVIVTQVPTYSNYTPPITTSYNPTSTNPYN